MASFEIVNLYTNVPIKETICTIKEYLTKKKYTEIFINDIEDILTTITNQNYFKLKDDVYKQKKGIPMGNPLSGILAEIFLQNLENNQCKNLIEKYKIKFMARYVDDILLIYDEGVTDITQVQNSFNNLNNNIKYTIEKEE
ncbi:hypothetical protein C0J52_23441 [Blattella germanica]|nr:hypothetical protein C0J52_23441 [Blattella germanica]PSN42892.1 hypothetical protein C0J52_23441 [Blattella germanica]